MKMEKLRRDTCGAISLMLALLIVPFYSVAGVLVEVSRYKSALSGLDDAVNTSAMAVLAQYDQFLMDRFGLMAMGQSEGNSLENGFTGQKSIEKQFAKYLKEQDTTDTRSFDLSSIQASGVYPLADLEVLRAQIDTYSATAVPMMLASDFGASGLQDIIGNLQKNIPYLSYMKAAGSGSKAVSKTVDYIDALDDASGSVKKLSEKNEAYNTAYEKYNSALSDIQNLLQERPGEDADMETMDVYAEKYNDLMQKVQDAQKEYKKSLQDEIDSTEKLSSILVKPTQKKNEEKDAYLTVSKDLAYATADAAVSKTEDLKRDDKGNIVKDEHGNAVKEKETQTLNKQIEEKEKLLKNENISTLDRQKTEAELKKLKDLKNDLNTTKNAVDGVASGTDSSQTNKILDKYNTDTCNEAMSGLLEEMDTLQKTDLEKLDADGIRKLQQSLHKTDMSQLADYNQFDSLLQEALNASKTTDSKVGFWSELAKTMSTFMDLSITYDPKLQSEINTTYYQENFNGLPGDKNRNLSENSLESPYEQQDSILAKANKDKVLIEAFAAGTWKPDLSGSVIGLLGDNKKSGDAKTTIGKLVKTVESLMSTISQATALVSTITNLNTNALENTILLPAYMRYMTTNRTEYDSATALTGTNIKGAGGLANEVANSQYNMAAWVQAQPETNYSFCGAETEYLIIGNTSEKTNQRAIFGYLMVIRLLTDYYPVTSNPEVKALCDGAAAILSAFGVPYELTCIILQSLAVMMEAYFDTVLICNGSDSIALIKGTDDIFLSAEGIPKLIGSVQSLATVSEDDKKLIAEKLGSLEEKGEIRAAFTTDGASHGDYLKSTDGVGIKMNYSSYLLIFMMIENKTVLLKRFANLVQMEATQRNLVNNASMSQNMSGQYPKFDLDKAYTVLRTEVKGKFVSVLPVLTLSKNSIWKADRVIYRGY